MQPQVRSETLASPPSLDMNVNRKFMLIGQTLFDNYAVMDLIGEGSFCYVYTAMQLDADNDAIVAVKTPKVVSPQVKERYQQAVVKQGKLKHPHIIRSLQYLESPDGQPFYIMENKQGVNLEEILQSVEKLDDEDAIALILSQTASALEYAHSHGVTHDRLTPHNILLIDENEQLQVKVTDFQIAAVADITGDTTSKERALCYLSPETLRGELSTPQSDVYSLAAIAFRMVTGKLPFDGKARADAEQLPEPLARYSPDLKQVHMLNQLVQESLDAEPSFRLDTIASFKEAVQEWIQTVHADLSAEPEYYTTEMSRPDLEPSAPDFSPPAPEPQPFAQASAPPPPAHRQEEPIPPVSPATPLVVPADELNNLVHDVAPQQRRRIRRAQTRTGAQSIRSTIKELVELKKKQTAQEQTVVMKFTEQVAAQSSGPRRSPLATMTRLIAFIVICGGVTIGCITYILTNPNQVREIYLQSARQLSMLLPGKAQEPEEIAIQEGPKIVKEAVVAPPKKAKLKPTEIHATPPQWAIPRMPGQTNNTSESPSFGVTNNSTATKRRPSRVRIEYRDFEDRPK
jgi:serine/threonine protein kinase